MTKLGSAKVVILIDIDDSEINYTDVSVNNSAIQELRVKQQQLEIKERLKREQFKPDLRFNYNFFRKWIKSCGEQPNASALSNLLLENYRLGYQFSYPLLLRKERGGLKRVKLEQLDNEYKMDYKVLVIQNKIQGIFQILNTTRDQQNTQASIARNFQKLLDAENDKFRIGESSIFLLNNREQKLIESQMKLLKLNSELQKLVSKLE